MNTGSCNEIGNYFLIYGVHSLNISGKKQLYCDLRFIVTSLLCLACEGITRTHNGTYYSTALDGSVQTFSLSEGNGISVIVTVDP